MKMWKRRVRTPTKRAGLFTDSLSLIINYHYSFFLLPFFKWIKELRLRMLNNLSKIIHVMAVSGQVRSDTKPLPFTALLLPPLWSFLWFSQFRLNFYFSEFMFNVQPLWLAYLLVKYRDCVFMRACCVCVWIFKEISGAWIKEYYKIIYTFTEILINTNKYQQMAVSVLKC